MYSCIRYIAEEPTMVCPPVLGHMISWIITSVASGQASVQPFRFFIQLRESFPFSYDPENFSMGFRLVTEKNSVT